MSVLEWKIVELFDLVTQPAIKLHDVNTEITANCCNLIKANGTSNLTLVLCDKRGNVHVSLQNGIKSKQISFKCHEKPQSIKLCALTNNNLLVILVQKNIVSLCIYIFDLNLIKKDGPSCISTTVLSTTSMATVLQVSAEGPEKLFALGIGFEKGDVLLYFGNINRDLLLNLRRHPIGLSPIHGIKFGTYDRQSDIKTCEVFVICLDGVYCVTLNNKNTIDAKIVLDNSNNMSNQCCTLSQPIASDSFLVVGRNDAIYCFRRDCRGPCYAIEGEKQFISWIDNYLLVVIKTHFGSTVTIVDVDNKLTVLHKRFSSVFGIVNGNNSYYIITKDENSKNICTYNIYNLTEHTTNNKVRTLIAQCMYNNAITMLKREGILGYENVAYVRYKYGNNLLVRGCFERAATEYAQTIGVLKPYHIISKLLNSRHNDNLIQYINELLQSKSTIEQQKLLENCFGRKNLDLSIRKLWISRNDTHVCDFKHISVRRINISNLTDLQDTDFNNANEDDIYNFFLEFGRELLSSNAANVLKTLKSLVKSQKINNILRFIIIFHDSVELNINLLSYFIENSSTCDEKLHYYLLTLYFRLWRDKKISSENILELMKKMPLRLEKILTLSKAYLFVIGIENLKASEYEIIDKEDKTYLQCVKYQIKRNPDLVSFLTNRHHSLLAILQNICSSQDIKLIDVKPFLIEKCIKYVKDANSEFQSIGCLNYEIAINSSLESNYKLNPIEFRNRYCDICHQLLHMPSVYFLCQHSFHKDCLRFDYNTQKEYDVGCVLCESNLKYLDSDDDNIELISRSCNIINGISNVFASGMDNLLTSEECVNKEYFMSDASNEMTQRITLSNTKNPFDNNYDSNSNCC